MTQDPGRLPRRPALLAAAGVALVAGSVAAGVVLQQLAAGSLATPAPAVLAVSVGSLGWLIVWRQPANRLGPVIAGVGIGFALAVLAAGLLEWAAHGADVPSAVLRVCYAWIWATGAMVCPWALVILWFPDGRFPSPGWRRFLIAASAVCVPFVAACYVLAPAGKFYSLFSGVDTPPGVAGPLADQQWEPMVGAGGAILLVPLVAIAGLVQRYRGSDAVVRQQVKWLLAGAALAVASQLAAAPLESAGGWPHTVGAVVGSVGQVMLVAGATVAILRYRLWEIELVVSRAVVFALLWAVLSVLLLVPALAAGLLVGGRGTLAAVALALLISVVFRPAAARAERLAERLAYRRRTTHVVPSGVLEQVRHAGDPAAVAQVVEGALVEHLAVPWARLWRSDGPALHTARAGADTAVRLPAAVEDRLRSSAGQVITADLPAELAERTPVAAAVPLAGGRDLLGVLVCGQRRGDPLRATDYAVVELLAHQAALRLRNLRLEDELRARLRQLEAQAEELRRSRQRLVSAQDEERRRIERNLHDGVQQQLVSLAIRLQRRTHPDDPDLVDLAAEAEQAVFTLQELARGIFPGVLVDRGLAAALRTQLARMPMAVHIDVSPDVLQRRLPPDVEAALYFVALEALTNAQKHAPDASAAVRLRSEGEAAVVLEVVDDGPGFQPGTGRGSGLQNMADRLAAVGGSLQIDTAPGRGTHVIARAPVSRDGTRGADPQPHLAEADSRR